MRGLKMIWCLVKGHIRSRRHVVEQKELRFSRCKRCGTKMVQTRDRKWLTLAAYRRKAGGPIPDPMDEPRPALG